MAVKPPKCKTCGKEEWRHICRPKLRRGAGITNPPRPKAPPLALKDFRKASELKPPVATATKPPVVMGAPKPKRDRKEYMRKLMAERRAKERAEREAEKAKQP